MRGMRARMRKRMRRHLCFFLKRRRVQKDVLTKIDLIIDYCIFNFLLFENCSLEITK